MAGNVPVGACLREVGEREFLLHGAGRITLALQHEKVVVGTQQQNGTVQFPDSVLGTQRLEMFKEFRLDVSALVEATGPEHYTQQS